MFNHAFVHHILYPAVFLFFFNDTATTEIYTLSLHDALPISFPPSPAGSPSQTRVTGGSEERRSEEHTSELQSHSELVCRLLLEKKNKKHTGSLLKKKKKKKKKKRKRKIRK